MMMMMVMMIGGEEEGRTPVGPPLLLAPQY